MPDSFPAGTEHLSFVFIEGIPFAVAFAEGVAEGAAEPCMGTVVLPNHRHCDGERDIRSFGVGSLPLVEPEGAVLPVVVGIGPIEVEETQFSDTLCEEYALGAFGGLVPVVEGAVGVLQVEFAVFEDEFRKPDASFDIIMDGMGLF